MDSRACRFVSQPRSVPWLNSRRLYSLLNSATFFFSADVSVSGSRYNVLGSPSLAHLIKNTAEAVPHPFHPNRTLWSARLDTGKYNQRRPMELASSELVLQRMTEEAEVFEDALPVAPLGSGSDYTVMLQRLGVCNLSGSAPGVLIASHI